MRIFFTILIISLFSCKSKKTNEIKKTILLNNTILNVKDFGAKGDFITDDSKAIQNCFYALEKKGGGIAYFPNGTYKVSRTTIAGKAWCLKGVNNIQIKGESKENTSIKLAENQINFTRMLVLEGNNKVTITNITFDGNVNQNNPENPNEHLGGIFIDHSNGIIINNSNFINTGGDGIGIRGVKTPSKNITISNCFFDNNQRNGLTLGSGFDGIIIKNNEFGVNIDDSPIDTEPSGGICQNVLIEKNTINTNSILTLGGPSHLNTGKNFKLLDNKLNNCSIFMVNADSVVIKKNSINIKHSKRAAITCLGSNNKIYVSDNNISINNKPAFYIVKPQHAKYEPKNIYINNNNINVKGKKTDAFSIKGSNNIFIENNRITGLNSNNGIYLFSNFKMNTISIKNNIFSSFRNGIKINPLKTNGIKNITIKNNKFLNKINTAIDYKYFGRKELNLLENIKIANNVFSNDIKTSIKQ